MNHGPVSLVSLRAVAAIVEHGSMTHAARMLDVTQPALSYQIRRLQDAVGCRLFTRSGRGLAPTAAGVRLAEAWRRVAAELDTALADLDTMAGRPCGTLRVSSVCFTSYHWLPAVLPRLAARHPGVTVSLDVTAGRSPFDALARGSLDVVLSTDPPAAERYRVVPLFDDEIVVVVPPSHRWAERRFLAAGELAEEPILVFDRTRSDVVNRVLVPAGVDARVVQVAVTETMLEMVKCGLGVGVLASWIAEPMLLSGELRAVRITEAGLPRRWHAVLSADEVPPRYVVDFIELVAGAPRASRLPCYG